MTKRKLTERDADDINGTLQATNIILEGEDRREKHRATSCQLPEREAATGFCAFICTYRTVEALQRKNRMVGTNEICKAIYMRHWRKKSE
ncbi:hypothetical protein SCLCIDRAFT_1221534 [Scleroderma citrinum Foug A]|uniref:Uncharacterized protein n=1 Tax=Scleroderma citrinum Foug A TaxID=1036808 RepID=A0A0C3DFQ8_9AGAM|nr:hypothetical protein SCLCIDRAFT_1221534 [Scleroderma citrinum Foug A]